MPDDEPETPPVSADGLPTINDDGTVTTDRPGWVWCRDVDTGHRFDVRSNRLPRRGVEPVPNVPVNYGRFARPAKPFVGKDGEAAAPAPRPDEVTSGDEARAEQITADAQATEQAVPLDQAPDVNETARPDAAFTVDTADTQVSGTAGSTTTDTTKTRKGAR